MKKIPFISDLVHYFGVFRSYAGKRLYILFALILLSGLAESLGITLVLPILDFGQPVENDNAIAKAIHAFINALGIEQTLLNLVLLLVAAFLIKGCIIFVQTVYASKTQYGMACKLRIMLCDKLSLVNYQYYVNSSQGYLTNAITVEAQTAVGIFGKYVQVVVQVVLIAVYIFSVMLMNWRMTLVLLTVGCAVFFCLRGLSGLSRRLSVQISNENAVMQSYLLQTINNFKYLKATAAFERLKRFLFTSIRRNADLNIKNETITAIPAAFVETAVVMVLGGLIIYYVHMQGRSIAEVMVLLLFFYKAFLKLFGLNVMWHKFNACVGGIEVVKRLFVDLEQHREVCGDTVLPGFASALQLEDVCFSYGDKRVLHNISLTIPRNRSVGIVGHSGAGKTTLFDVMTGLVKPDCGRIAVDGVDYEALRLDSLREKIGYVTQEPVIFSDTIANNISLFECGMSDAPCRDRIQSAARAAHCEAFIREAADGYETVIGDRGIRLSGGQRQRLAIARELFKEPEIMIFDEATSALDSASEKAIQQSIAEMAGKRTIVLIAHRLSTVRDCDIIYVLEEGRVVEHGAYATLYADTSSRFHAMCKAQQL
ncbi:MAG: ABC transporter ATP-binding protein [Desulfovibrionaceae bacterium]